MIGHQIGSYRVVEQIGEGGMGVVYRAVDEQLERSVALKFLARELTRDTRAKERFLVEARAASRLDHPNVCTVYEAGETEEGDAYLAMAYYEGETLERRLARGPLPLDEALDLARQVASGLERAHAAGIVHRDVKPGNIMVTNHGEAKLLDFGLARLRDEARHTREGTTLGTPAYMAPEQLRAEEAGPPADVWGLGVVLFEMLAGRPPFGRAAATTPSLILHEETPRLSGHCPDVPPAVEAIVGRALAKEPGQRFAEGGEMLRALGSATSADSDSRAATLSAMPSVDGSRRARRRWLGGLLVAAAVVALVGWVVTRGRSVKDVAATPDAAGSASAIAVLPFDVRGDPEWGYLGEGMVDLLATKLDGAGELRAVDPNAVLAAARGEELSGMGPSVARRVSARLGAGLFVLGDAVASGGSLHITATLYGSEDGEPLARATVEGDGGELFRLIDDLTTELLAGRFADPGARVAKTAALTSESLPAVKRYLQGESLFRAGRFIEALGAFQEAVSADPDFALAWYRISVTAEWATRLELIDPAANRANDLAARLSERDRRLLEARAVARAGRVVEAERLYRAIVRAYPDEMEAWSQLAEVLSHYRFHTGRSLAESRPALEMVLGLEPNNVSALWHLARVAAVEGEAAELTELAERLLPITPESERRLEIQALRMYGTGDTRGEEPLLRRLADSEDRVVSLAAWNVCHATDHMAGCARIVELLDHPSRPPAARAWARAALASVALADGQPREARRYLRLAREQAAGLGLEILPPIAVAAFASVDEQELEALRDALDGWAAEETPPAEAGDMFAGPHEGHHAALRHFGLGILEVRLGRPEARERVAALDAMRGQLAADLARTVRGYQALLVGDAATAASELDAIDLSAPIYNYNDAITSIYSGATLPRYLHAHALIDSGRLEEAVRRLESFGETSAVDRAFEPPARILAGEALLRLGRPAQAAEAFRRALYLWADADAELEPWLERARLGLERSAGAS